jgi:hypothetical protein
MQQAKKEVTAATAAGIDHNTPQDKLVAAQAQRPQQQVPLGAAPQAARPLGSQVPGMIARPTFGGAPTAAPAAVPTAQTTPQRAAAAMAPTIQPTPAAGVPPAAQGRSATPYADQFLKQQVATIAENPLYTAQLKQQQKVEQLREQYLLPKIFDAQAKFSEEQMKQGEMDKRTVYAGTIKLKTEADKLLNEKDIADERTRTALMISNQRTAGAMAIAEKRLNAQYGASNAPGIKGTPLQAKIQDKIISDLNADVNTTLKAQDAIGLQLSQNRDAKGNVIDQQQEINLQHQKDTNDLALSQYMQHRKEKMEEFWNISPEDAIGKYTRGYGGDPTRPEAKPAAAAKPTAGRAAPVGEASRATALGLETIPEPEFDVRTGKLLPEAVLRNAKQAGIDAVTTGTYKNKPTVTDRQGNIYDATTYKRIGVTEPTRTEPTVVGAGASDEDSAAESEASGEHIETGDPELDKYINF